MLELSESNVTNYLRENHRASAGEILVQSLSGGVANVVLKIFDTDAGERIGTDLRTPGQIKLGKPDKRGAAGLCFVLKQPLPKFKTEAEWLVDIGRVLVERDALLLLAELLPAGSVPSVLWFDEPNHILAISAAPTGSLIWKQALLTGEAKGGGAPAATHAGMLLAIMHSSTHHEPPLRARYGDPKFFIQQRIDPYLRHTAAAHPDVAPQILALADKLLATQLCLIHGDFSPKNIFLVPEPDPSPTTPKPRNPDTPTQPSFALAHLMLLDFEVTFYGHPAFDVATLINHLLLKGFYHDKKWRPFMVMADAFWQTYRHTAVKELVHAASAIGGQTLGALLLARIDGKSPAEYLTDQAVKDRIRTAAKDLLNSPDPSLDTALDLVSLHFEEPD